MDGAARRTIWRDGEAVAIIDQTLLPHRLCVRRLDDVAAVAEAIAVMRVRGAPLIGATAAYGMALAAATDPSDAGLTQARAKLFATRPTAVNLGWALERVMRRLAPLLLAARVAAAWDEAARIADEDVALNAAIGDHGLPLIEAVHARTGRPVNILTHCNAGWLAAVGWGPATAPIYKAHQAGIPVHVFVDETRPRLQGASLTVWELAEAGVPHTLIADNAGGHLMRRGLVDLCLVGTDRTAANGDVCNKVGTYLKALAAHDSGVPFYVGLPSPSLDLSLPSGDHMPIEERAAAEVTDITGRTSDGRIETVRIVPEGTAVANPAFDVTPARLVTALITERGVVRPDELAAVFSMRLAAE